MPLHRCGTSGWKWGENGKCYYGPNAKKNAIKQGISYEGPEKVQKILAHNINALPYEVDVAIAEYRITKEN
jgi:hypothetical protein